MEAAPPFGDVPPTRRQFLRAAGFGAPALAMAGASRARPSSLAMARVEPGAFPMGTPSGFLAHERPRRMVRIGRPFAMGTDPVTAGLFAEVMGLDAPDPSDRDAARRAATGLSWFDAIRFCNRLGHRDGLPPFYNLDGGRGGLNRNGGYRLPTEAEWEYACRAGTVTRYVHGDDPEGLERFAWFGQPFDAPANPVGRKEPNPWGLRDMAGNVEEWCWDWFHEASYAHLPDADPTGPSRGTFRVTRGGSRLHTPIGLRSAARGRWSPSHRSPCIGLRVARTLGA